MIKANKHKLIAERIRLVRMNMKHYQHYLRLKADGLTSKRFGEWLRED